MILTKQNPEQAPPLSLTEFKEHLYLDLGVIDDAVQDSELTGYLHRAMELIEQRTGKSIIKSIRRDVSMEIILAVLMLATRFYEDRNGVGPWGEGMPYYVRLTIERHREPHIQDEK